MEGFLISPKSGNVITGQILVTTSPRRTCPDICPLKKTTGNGACYAEHGYLGHYIWGQLERQDSRMKIYRKAELLAMIRALPARAIWRHNQAGDLPTLDRETIDRASLMELVDANQGRRGFTYTHFDVLRNLHNRQTVKLANDGGFTVNLSANSLAHADQLAALGIAPVVVVLPTQQTANTRTAEGRKVSICPAQTVNLTCDVCQVCAKQRKAIIGFPATGPKKRLV